MPYLARYPSSDGRTRSGRAGRAHGLGDVISDLQSFFTWAPATSYAALAAQVNRFGSSAPAAYQFAPTPFTPDSVKLDPALATVALTIYQRRATDAYNQFGDQGSLAAITAANQGFADPVAFVSSHLADVQTAVSGFADSLGLPAAASSAPGGAPDPSVLLAAAAGVALLWWMGR